jgi:hypothetical protein
MGFSMKNTCVELIAIAYPVQAAPREVIQSREVVVAWHTVNGTDANLV